MRPELVLTKMANVDEHRSVRKIEEYTAAGVTKSFLLDGG